MTGKLDRI